MNNIHCIYPDRDATLAGYLYDDIDQAERIAFDAHLAGCRLCADELDELRGVRDTLGQWTPPEPARGSLQSPVFSHQSSSTQSRSAWWHNVPVWAQMAAAMLVLGASASIANLDIRYDSAGLSVRTGWSKAAPAAQTAAPVAVATASQGVAPWRGELTALENQLRSEMRAQAAPVRAASVTSASAVGAMSEAELRQRVRVLLDEQEKKQEQDLALHLVQLQRDSNAQRQADIRRTNQLFRDVMSTYGDEIVKQQKQINYLLPISEK